MFYKLVLYFNIVYIGWHHFVATIRIMTVGRKGGNSLWFLFNPRINLSPFTKDFRGEEHYNESID